MPASTEVKYVGTGRARAMLERSPSVLMRLALTGEIEHQVSPDGRMLFSVEGIRAAKQQLGPKQERGRRN